MKNTMFYLKIPLLVYELLLNTLEVTGTAQTTMKT